MKKIPLTKNAFALIDDEDFDRISKFKWQLAVTGYAVRNEYQGTSQGKRKTKQYFMHREIMETPKGMTTDHINHNKIDNQKLNLRICTKAQNNANRTGRGVSWDKRTKKWRARVGRKWIGRYKELDDALMAYNEAAIKKYGEFANINIII
jgi:glucosamine 6-phosphate synthetase-like amidotransferase/phosphosugar isomerase protein